ncbi:MAG: hypothetical protein KY476_13185 [Planctomycetes bacterium]|nr:hypothetical protein [Planctomycetota bacterium]
MSVRFTLPETDVAVEVPPVQIFTSGTDAGYVELSLRADQALPMKKLYDHLRLVVPGELNPLRPTAHDEQPGGVVLTFFSAEVSNSSRPPHTLSLLWKSADKRVLGAVPFEVTGSRRLREVTGDAELAGHKTRADVE